MVMLRSPSCFEVSYCLLSVAEHEMELQISEMKGNFHSIDLWCKETGNVPTHPPSALKWIKIYNSVRLLASCCFQQWTSHACTLSHIVCLLASHINGMQITLIRKYSVNLKILNSKIVTHVFQHSLYYKILIDLLTNP